MDITLNSGNFKMNGTNLAFLKNNVFAANGPNFTKGIEIALQYLKDLALATQNHFHVSVDRKPSELRQEAHNTNFNCFLYREGFPRAQFRMVINSSDGTFKENTVDPKTLLAEYVDVAMEVNREQELYMDKSVFTSLRGTISALASAATVVHAFPINKDGGVEIDFEFIDEANGASHRITIGFNEIGYGTVN